MTYNRLQNEQSPYLLQHANNPVDWYPWGDEAFNVAKAENKPIFLSIGYATCHWCHVMAHESFEDQVIAEMMNETFINIKVDREERPDIDNTYMTVCQMVTGHGGWPLTIIMTPDQKPFFAGTYIPKDTRFERIGMRQLIPAVEHTWRNEYESIEKATVSIEDGFRKQQLFEKGALPSEELTDEVYKQLSLRFDPEYGGFGISPKFPTPHNLLFLLRYHLVHPDSNALQMVTHTLKMMRCGGIYDQIGFGFHRYSTDREWLLPHFEKMLYDQALLMITYAEAYQLTKDELFKQTIDELATYVMRDLSHPGGGFYSAEDADSEGEEGLFYVWSFYELQNLLSDSDMNLLSNAYSISKEGNFKDEATKKSTGNNILHLLSPGLKEYDDGLDDRLAHIREILFEKRQKRIRPELDDKILTDWNALMIAAFAKSGYILKNQQYIDIAKTGISFIEENLIDNARLLHRYRNGQADIDAFADDYAFLVWALIELYQATFESEYLTKAIYWNNEFIKFFWDEENHGFMFTKKGLDQPLGEQYLTFDGAIPSSNSVALLNLLRLGRLTGKTDYEQKADSMLQLFGEQMNQYGVNHTQMLQAVQFLRNRSQEVIIAEGKKGMSVNLVMDQIRKSYLPNAVFALRPAEGYDLIYEFSNYIDKQIPIDEQTSVYFCENYVCKRPVTDFPSLKTMLKDKAISITTAASSS